MALSYNEIAGRSAERVGALSDGVFAFAMTLLALDLRVPVSDAVHSETALRVALSDLAPNLLTYLLSSRTFGIFWVGQHTQIGKLKHSDRALTWIHLAFLLMVTLIPFTTKLLAAFITYRTALVIYWLNIVGLGAMLYWNWGRARKDDLVKEETLPGIDAAVRRRIIAFIVLVQLNYVVAPRVGFLRRL